MTFGRYFPNTLVAETSPEFCPSGLPCPLMTLAGLHPASEDFLSLHLTDLSLHKGPKDKSY